MSITGRCEACGGVLGVDCFNPGECMSITHDILTRSPSSEEVEEEMKAYDAGLLSDYGGGNVEWWQDYIRAELERAHDFYVAQTCSPSSEEVERLKEEIDGLSCSLADERHFSECLRDQVTDRESAVERLKEEVQRLQKLAKANNTLARMNSARAEAAEARNTRLQALVGEKDAALAPFAAAADGVEGSHSRRLSDDVRAVDYLPLSVYRRARAAHQKSEASAFSSPAPVKEEVKPVNMRKVAEALGFEPDNHHNALRCPYCNPRGLEFAPPPPEARREEIARIISGAPFPSKRALKKADEILALLAAQTKEEGWRGIESAPKDETFIDVSDRYGTRTTDVKWDTKRVRWEFWHGSWDNEWLEVSPPPTHWMPLPAAPVPEGEER